MRPRKNIELEKIIEALEKRIDQSESVVLVTPEHKLRDEDGSELYGLRCNSDGLLLLSINFLKTLLHRKGISFIGNEAMYSNV